MQFITVHSGRITCVLEMTARLDQKTKHEPNEKRMNFKRIHYINVW